MRHVCTSILGGFTAVAIASAAGAQSATPPSSPPSPPSPTASAAAPMTAASKALGTRNPAIIAAENAKEPGVQRPEERVIPQISVPLSSKRDRVAAAIAASAAAHGPSGAVNDGAARCRAFSERDRAACERARPASAP